MGFLDDLLGGGADAKQKKFDALSVESAIIDKQIEIEEKKRKLRDMKMGKS